MDTQRMPSIGLALDDVVFCALDIETTQVAGQPGALSVIELAAQEFSGGRVTKPMFQTLVNPCCPIRPFDTKVSGITDNMVAGSPTFQDVYDDFLSYIDDRPLVAHNAPFDKRAIQSICSTRNLEPPENIYIDTAAMLRKTIDLPKYSLEAAADYFRIPYKEKHRASGDCQSVFHVFEALRVRLHGSHGIKTLGQLFDFLGMETQPSGEQQNLFG